ncbi:MAG TPA: signal peptide peptidase SppA [Anaeromyxobacteraceae bacterium]|nr:signal peptide peptidase SppA [Anaeromyxobacteraceae bacterium]
MSEEQKPPEGPGPSASPGEPLPTSPPPAPVAPPAVASQPSWGGPPPPTWAAPPPPAIPPPAPPRRDRAALAVVLFVFGGLFVVFLAFLLLAYGAVKGEGPRLGGGPRIGVVEVKGEIGAGVRGSVDADETLRVIKRYMDDGDMKAVVVRIDSPGGAVAPSQEIYDELKKLAEKKTVVCSMGNLAASGGFYIAMACPHILAEPGTLTGSIGVISQFPNVKGLVERFHVKMETIKSGKLKDAGNPFREMTPEDRAYWQSLIDQVYLQFLQAVVESRDLPEEEVRKIADGRVLTGQQAQQLGLIDELGNFNDAVDTAKEEAGLSGEPRLVYPPEERSSRIFEDLLGGAVHSVADAVRSEIHHEAGAAASPGVYYLAR